MKLTYLSHSCVFIETSTHRLIIDPFLTGNAKAQITPADVRCDFVLVTHGHYDHLGDAVEIAKNNDATIIAMYEVADFLAQKKVKTHGMGVGGAHDFPFGRVKMTIAFHSAGYAPGGELVKTVPLTEGHFIYLGNPAGILLTAEGKTIYHAGDTALTLEMKLLGERNKIDVAFLPIGDNFTMGIEDAAVAAEFLQCGLAIPIHFNTFDLIKADPNAFVHRVEASGLRARALAVGESFEI